MALVTTLIYLLLHLLIYSIPPIIGSLLDKNNQINLNYTYLGVLFTLTQLFDSLYAIPINDNLSLNGGDIAYSALLFATIYLISSQAEAKVVRNLIYIFGIIASFLFLLFGLISELLISGLAENYLNITNAFLEFSIKSLMLTLILFSAEVLLILSFIIWFSSKTNSSKIVSLSIGTAYILVLLIDGILYPIGINFLFQGANLSITNGIFAKMIFGPIFGLILLGLLITRPRNLSDFGKIRTPIIRYLLPPKRRELARQLEKAEMAIDQLAKAIPICASCKKIRDDEGYWDQLETFMKKHRDITFSHGLCPECVEKALTEYENEN